jgi:hypothetical protein
LGHEEMEEEKMCHCLYFPILFTRPLRSDLNFNFFSCDLFISFSPSFLIKKCLIFLDVAAALSSEGCGDTGAPTAQASAHAADSRLDAQVRFKKK